MASKSITLGGNITELTLITPIIPGRLAALEQVLLAVQKSVEEDRDHPIKKISTIHYARWAIFDRESLLPPAERNGGVDGAKWLLFTSNFDGSWEQYLRDFSLKIPEGLDRIWSNCVGYPAGGSADFDEFKKWVDSYQIRVNLYYAAYPTLKVPDVLRAQKIEAAVDAFQQTVSEI